MKYENIVKIDIELLKRNSKGNYIALTRPLPFLVLSSNKGRKAYFGLHFMSKKTVYRLLIDLVEKCDNKEVLFDIDNMMKTFNESKFSTK